MNWRATPIRTRTPVIDDECTIEEGVIIGYISGRSIDTGPTTIGRGAVIRSGTVIYDGVTIGKSIQTGHHVLIREENRIGDNVAIWSNTVIDYGCTIGSNVLMHNNVYICQFTVIEDDVFVGPGVVMTNDRYPVNKRDLRGPTLRKGARLGANVTVLPAVVIGEGSLIGSGSVVTRDVPPSCIAYGNPARVHRNLS